MLLWVLFAVMTALVVWVLLRPLTAAGGARQDAAEADIAVYRDQLAEIDRDRERGLLAPAEAEAARTEISRRLLARIDAAGAERGGAHASAALRLSLVRTALAVGIPAIALGGYLFAGSPGLPGQPHAARAKTPIADAALGDMIARVEARLREKPDDGQGWDVIAPVYLKLGRFEDARQAYARAIEFLGETPKRLNGFAEATVLSRDGIVDETARAAFAKVAAAEPTRPEPRFWLAAALEQDGKFAEAAEAYRALLAIAGPTAPWRGAVEERLRVLAARQGKSDTDAGRGATPSKETLEAASRMSKAEQDQMISGMVEGLAQRLKVNGNDLTGWQRLMRAYVVLGDKAKAKTALADARRALTADANAIAALDALANELGITP